MAQSRPPPVRTHSAVASSPPPLSPRTNSEKRHHSRRKSGKDYVPASDRKTTKPAPLTKRTTPQYVTKVGPGWSGGRRKDRDGDEEDRGRDSAEGFPQFCMSCEKQFLPANNTFLYCSESCRLHDLAPARAYPARTNSYPSYSPSSPPLTPYTRHFSSYPSTAPAHEDGPDIVPRFSPTQSRPRSYFNSDPYPQSYQMPSTISTSPLSNNVYSNSHSSTALASLRELATALPRTTTSASRRVPDSPPKSSASSIGKTASDVWNYIPFTSSGSKTATPTPSTTPGNSYSSHGTYSVSQSYGRRSREDLYSYGANHGTTVGGYGNTGGMGMDRPLPPRSGPGGYGHRPKSIDLVTPFSGH